MYYKLKHGLTMGAQHEMLQRHKDINEEVLQEMDQLAERDKGKYEPVILTAHVEEAINNIQSITKEG
jgi:hypothetical protein